MGPLISAIVLNYRTPQDAVRCVQALLRQTVADRLEIIVVENHSGDDSIGVLRNRLGRFPSVRIVETRDNLGYGGGNNAGERFARGDFLLIINPDNELQPRALEQMAAAMQADPGIGILAPKLMHEDGTVRDSFRAFPTVADVLIKRTPLRRLFPGALDRYLQRRADHDTVREADWLAGACLLMRRPVFEWLGGFDERFFLFFEDIDLCRRVWEDGLRVVYFPQAVALDRKRRLSEGGMISLLLRRAGRVHLRSAAAYFRKWRGRPDPQRKARASG